MIFTKIPIFQPDSKPWNFNTTYTRPESGYPLQSIGCFLNILKFRSPMLGYSRKLSSVYRTWKNRILVYIYSNKRVDISVCKNKAVYGHTNIPKPRNINGTLAFSEFHPPIGADYGDRLPEVVL